MKIFGGETFSAWARQPTTIHALTIVGTALSAGLSNVVTGDPKVDAIVALIVYVLGHLIPDDNTAKTTPPPKP
jgi:hypothetical protein